MKMCFRSGETGHFANASHNSLAFNVTKWDIALSSARKVSLIRNTSNLKGKIRHSSSG
jgi:hypothetical protein